MAGRKQHFIPQFLLRSFGSAGSGRKTQVRVVTREKNFVVPTDGIAAQREFYSRLDEGPDSLDNLITEAETEYADLHRAFTALPQGSLADSNGVARLLAHLTMRGSHLRDTFSLAGQRVLTEAVRLLLDPTNFQKMIGIAGDAPSPRFLQSLSGAYTKRRKKFAKIKVSRFTFQRMAFKYAKENWAQMYVDMKPFLLMALDINATEAAAEGQKKALLDSLEPAKRVDWLSELEWKIVEAGPHALVLPDSIAIAHSEEEKGVAPLAYMERDDVTGIIFPITTGKAICSGVYANDLVLDKLLSDFTVFAALCSWNFMVLEPSLPVSPNVARVLGDSVASLLRRKIEEAIQGMLAEAAAE